MKKTITNILIGLVFFWSGTIAAKNFIDAPNGVLVFGGDHALNSINLKTCKVKQLYNEEGMFTKISKIDDHRFLFFQYGPEGDNLKIFDLTNNKAKLLYRNATSPYYNAKHKKIFFYFAPSYKEGNGLYEANVKSTISNLKKISDARSAYENIIPISDDEIVFIKREKSNSNDVYLYDLISKKISLLSIQNCTLPTVWRSATQQLLCFNRKQQQYFLTDLSGKNMQLVKKGMNFLPVRYLPDYDALLYTVTSFSLHDPEEGHLAIYDFATGKSKILCDKVKLGTGDAAYYPM